LVAGRENRLTCVNAAKASGWSHLPVVGDLGAKSHGHQSQENETGEEKKHKQACSQEDRKTNEEVCRQTGCKEGRQKSWENSQENCQKGGSKEVFGTEDSQKEQGCGFDSQSYERAFRHASV